MSPPPPPLSRRYSGERSKENVLRRLYYGLESPACYTAQRALLREAQKCDARIGAADVVRFLAAQRTYTRHRRVVRKFARMRTVPAGLHTDWQADLAIFDAYARHNDGYRYLLVCVDVLSRQLFVAPVRSKRSRDMRDAFERLFKRNGGVRPWKLTTDQGLEFNARAMLDYFRAKDIRKQCMYTNPTLHAGMVERANRTIKERLYRYFSERNTRRWVDVVQKIVDAINATPCRTTGVAPNRVTFRNAARIRRDVYVKPYEGRRKATVARFRVGDTVRVEKHKGVFAKGYTPNFTDELYRVVEVRRRTPVVVYRLAEERSGEVLRGWFYASEMCRVDGDATTAGMYRVENVVQTRQRRSDGRRELFVKWAGYPPAYNTWVDEEDIVLAK